MDGQGVSEEGNAICLMSHAPTYRHGRCGVKEMSYLCLACETGITKVSMMQFEEDHSIDATSYRREVGLDRYSDSKIVVPFSLSCHFQETGQRKKFLIRVDKHKRATKAQDFNRQTDVP